MSRGARVKDQASEIHAIINPLVIHASTQPGAASGDSGFSQVPSTQPSSAESVDRGAPESGLRAASDGAGADERSQYAQKEAECVAQKQTERVSSRPTMTWVAQASRGGGISWVAPAEADPGDGIRFSSSASDPRAVVVFDKQHRRQIVLLSSIILHEQLLFGKRLMFPGSPLAFLGEKTPWRSQKDSFLADRALSGLPFKKGSLEALSAEYILALSHILAHSHILAQALSTSTLYPLDPALDVGESGFDRAALRRLHKGQKANGERRFSGFRRKIVGFGNFLRERFSCAKRAKCKGQKTKDDSSEIRELLSNPGEWRVLDGGMWGPGSKRLDVVLGPYPSSITQPAANGDGTFSDVSELGVVIEEAASHFETFPEEIRGTLDPRLKADMLFLQLWRAEFSWLSPWLPDPCSDVSTLLLFTAATLRLRQRLVLKLARSLADIVTKRASASTNKSASGALSQPSANDVVGGTLSQEPSTEPSSAKSVDRGAPESVLQLQLAASLLVDGAGADEEDGFDGEDRKKPEAEAPSPSAETGSLPQTSSPQPAASGDSRLSQEPSTQPSSAESGDRGAPESGLQPASSLLVGGAGADEEGVFDKEVRKEPEAEPRLYFFFDREECPATGRLFITLLDSAVPVGSQRSKPRRSFPSPSAFGPYDEDASSSAEPGLGSGSTTTADVNTLSQTLRLSTESVSTSSADPGTLPQSPSTQPATSGDSGLSQEPSTQSSSSESVDRGAPKSVLRATSLSVVAEADEHSENAPSEEFVRDPGNVYAKQNDRRVHFTLGDGRARGSVSSDEDFPDSVVVSKINWVVWVSERRKSRRSFPIVPGPYAGNVSSSVESGLGSGSTTTADVSLNTLSSQTLSAESASGALPQPATNGVGGTLSQEPSTQSSSAESVDRRAPESGLQAAPDGTVADEHSQLDAPSEENVSLSGSLAQEAPVDVRDGSPPPPESVNNGSTKTPGTTAPAAVPVFMGPVVHRILDFVDGPVQSPQTIGINLSGPPIHVPPAATGPALGDPLAEDCPGPSSGNACTTSTTDAVGDTQPQTSTTTTTTPAANTPGGADPGALPQESNTSSPSSGPGDRGPRDSNPAAVLVEDKSYPHSDNSARDVLLKIGGLLLAATLIVLGYDFFFRNCVAEA